MTNADISIIPFRGKRNAIMEENWSGLPQGETELTVESEAYLELAKEDISKCKYEMAPVYRMR